MVVIRSQPLSALAPSFGPKFRGFTRNCSRCCPLVAVYSGVFGKWLEIEKGSGGVGDGGVGRGGQCGKVAGLNQLLMPYTHRSVRLAALIREDSFTVDGGD